MTIRSEDTGRQLPEFTLPEIGSDRSLGPRDFVGKPTVLYMWASW
jgi:hypothetical protein